MASITGQVQVGQKVNVNDVESGCRLTIVDGSAAGLTVVEAAPDYLVLEDAAGEVLTRIPAYLIRGVTIFAPEAPVSAETPLDTDAVAEAPATPLETPLTAVSEAA